jgi:hypothetical protein
LLVAASAGAAAVVESALRAAQVPIATIGTVVAAQPGVHIVVRP